MTPIKFKKNTDTDNYLGFDEIIIISQNIARIRSVEGTQYLTTIADGTFLQIHEDDWPVLEECYKVEQGEK